MHGGVEGHSFAGLASEVVLLAEDIHQLRGELLVGVRVGLVGVLAHLHEELDVVELLQLVAVLVDGAADEAVFFEFLRPAVGGVYKRVDGVSDLAGRVVLMQLPLDPFLAELAVELNRGHVHEPEVLLLPAVVLPSHFEVELDLGFVLVFVHEEVDLKGVEGQQILTVAVDDLDQLL